MPEIINNSAEGRRNDWPEDWPHRVSAKPSERDNLAEILDLKIERTVGGDFPDRDSVRLMIQYRQMKALERIADQLEAWNYQSCLATAQMQR